NFINDGTCHINNTDAAGGTFVHTIDFKRNFLNNGTFSGALDFQSGNLTAVAVNVSFTSSTQSQSISVTGGSVAMQNMSINNSFGTVTTGSTGFTVNGNWTVASNLTLGSGAITLSGTLTKTGGTLDATTNSSTLIISGTGSKSFTINASQTMNNITLNKSSGSWTVNGGAFSLSINGTFTRTAGPLAVNGGASFRYTSSGSLTYNGSSLTSGIEWPTSVSDAPKVVKFAPSSSATYTLNTSSLPVLTGGAVIVDGSTANPTVSGSGSIAYGSGAGLVYTGNTAHTVGLEWTASQSIDSVLVNNSAGITIASGSRYVNKVLTLTAGELKQPTAGDSLYLGGSLV
ncbi:hypothetical protein KDA23_06025, partial [Candidatus Saccharibacteria bacterium]|nr:hypothetical protein [Candidatus Saccharibacteria bacterium]